MAASEQEILAGLAEIVNEETGIDTGLPSAATPATGHTSRCT